MDAKFFYANAVGIAMTPYDVSLRFMRNGVADTFQAPAPGQTVSMQPVSLEAVTVSMSPHHAKAMVSALYKSVVDYEKQFGTLGLEPAAQQAFDAAFAASRSPAQ